MRALLALACALMVSVMSGCMYRSTHSTPAPAVTAPSPPKLPTYTEETVGNAMLDEIMGHYVGFDDPRCTREQVGRELGTPLPDGTTRPRLPQSERICLDHMTYAMDNMVAGRRALPRRPGTRIVPVYEARYVPPSTLGPFADRLDSPVIYVRIRLFTHELANRFYDDIVRILSEHDLDVATARPYVIVDLERTPGGKTLAARNLMCLIVDDPERPLFGTTSHRRTIMFYASADQGKLVYVPSMCKDNEKRGLLKNVRFYFLIDRDTASAAEILPGALYEYPRVGEVSYGKRTEQLAYFYAIDENVGYRLQYTHAHVIYPPAAGMPPGARLLPDCRVERSSDYYDVAGTIGDPLFRAALSLASGDRSLCNEH